MLRYSGRSPGHARNAFQYVIDAFYEWNTGKSEPTVKFEDREINICVACGFVGNCTDLLSVHCLNTFGYCDIEPRTRTYAAAAGALKPRILKEFEPGDLSKGVPVQGPMDPPAATDLTGGDALRPQSPRVDARLAEEPQHSQ